jgi:hypothetical protein
MKLLQSSFIQTLNYHNEACVINLRISISPLRRVVSIIEINELHIQSPEGGDIIIL